MLAKGLERKPFSVAVSFAEAIEKIKSICKKKGYKRGIDLVFY
jgi:hypothetical protein